jgi:hypothetical protein
MERAERFRPALANPLGLRAESVSPALAAYSIST